MAAALRLSVLESHLPPVANPNHPRPPLPAEAAVIFGWGLTPLIHLVFLQQAAQRAAAPAEVGTGTQTELEAAVVAAAAVVGTTAAQLVAPALAPPVACSCSQVVLRVHDLLEIIDG